MAVFRHSVKSISRGKGQSVIASIAYRSGMKLRDNRLDKEFNYSNKKDVAYTEILAPTNAPDWVYDRETLWNEVEAFEKRKDAQLAREVQVSLPIELSNEQKIELLRTYVQEVFVDQGMIADFAIHDIDGKNPHAHILLTLRHVNEQGFGLKNRDWNQKPARMMWRERWAEIQNLYLERNGIDCRVDHRSYADRGIELVSQNVNKENYHGVSRGDAEILSRKELEKKQQENYKIICQKPEVVLEFLSKQHSTFTQSDIDRCIASRTVDAEQFMVARELVMQSMHLVKLGIDQHGEERFTAVGALLEEQALMKHIDALAHRGRHGVATHRIDRAIAKKTHLSEQQQVAIRHLCSSDNLSLLQGAAGSGKSYLLESAREAWEAQGYTVKGGALAGVVAASLAADAGIAETHSVAGWLSRWERGVDHLSASDVLVIDEANMLGTRQLKLLSQEVDRAGAKLVLVGDRHQLQAIELGGEFGEIAKRHGCATLDEVRRQKSEWQREATKHFSHGEASRALNAYLNHGHIELLDSHDAARSAAFEAYCHARQANPQGKHLLLAHTKKDVTHLNLEARDLLLANPKGHTYRLHDGKRVLSQGERIMFTLRNRELGVENGTLGNITAISTHGDILVLLDNGRSIAFNLKDHDHFDYGYAMTVHKSEGTTVDEVFLLASRGFDRFLSYVGLSRHRSNVRVYGGQDQFKSMGDLVTVMSRDRPKDLIITHENVEHLKVPSDFAFKREQLSRKLRTIVKGHPGLSDEMKACLDGVEQYRTLTDQAADAWDRVSGLQGAPRQLAIQAAQRASVQRDRQAQALLQHNHGQVEAAMRYEDLPYSTLTMRAKTCDEIDAYLHESSDMKKAQMAHHMRANMLRYRAGLEEANVYSEAIRLSRHHTYIAVQQESPDTVMRERIRAVHAYEEKRLEAGRAYGELKQAERLGRATDELKLAARHLGAQRNQLAFGANQLFLRDGFDRPAVQTLSLDAEKLQQFAKQHIVEEQIKGYLSASGIERGEIANTLLADRSCYHMLFQYDLNFKLLSADAKEYRALIQKRHSRHDIAIRPTVYKHWDIDLINDRLMQDVEATYHHIFGEPQKRQGKELRYGDGLVVTRSGAKAGFWYDFAQGKGGTPIQAIQYAKGLDFKAALEEAASLAGLSELEAQIITRPPTLQQDRRQKAAKAEALEQKQGIITADNMWRAGVSIKNTLAERYLREHRYISDTSRLNMRYLPKGQTFQGYNKDGNLTGLKHKLDCLLIPIGNDRGKVTGVQRIFLDSQTANKPTYMKNAKLTRGHLKGSAGLIQKGTNGRLYIAEGPETAASIAMADPQATVLASLSVSNLNNLVDKVKQYEPKEIIFAKDNDGLNAPSELSYLKAERTFKEAGLIVKTIEPKMPQHVIDQAQENNKRPKYDYNDLLKDKGITAVRNSMGIDREMKRPAYWEHLNKEQKAILGAPGWENIKPTRTVDEFARNPLESIYHFHNRIIETCPTNKAHAQKLTDILLENWGKITKRPTMLKEVEQKAPLLAKQLSQQYTLFKQRTLKQSRSLGDDWGISR